MMAMTWEHTKYLQPYIAPLELVDAAIRKVPMSTAAASSGGVNQLTGRLSSVRFALTQPNTGVAEGNCVNKRHVSVKQSLGVVETGLGVWARLRRAPQAEKSQRVGNLKLMPVTNPTP